MDEPDILPPPWAEALALFEADLRRRGAAEKTRTRVRRRPAPVRALVRGAEPGARPGHDQDAAPLRAAPGGARRARRRHRRPQARRAALASTAALREHGLISQNPADLVPAPKRPQKLPRVLKPDEVAALLDRIPASTPLDHRDRALFELAYACGLRAEELVDLDVASVDFDAEEVRVEGKGSKTRIVPVGESALRALARYLERARPALSDRAPSSPRCSCRSPAAGSPRPTCAGGCGRAPGWPRCRAECIRTRCAIRLRRTCWRAERICGRSRSFSATRASPRRRSTLG